MDIEQLGPYRLLRRLGRGGMGIVFEGVNTETGEPAAIKMLDAALAEEEGFRERFRTEIETLRKLNHPGIVRLLGFGEQDGRFFYAMEFVDGASLDQHMLSIRRLGWLETAGWAIEMCRALRHAHDRGIIHRDLKPANLLVTRDGHIKLADFGIARLFGHARVTAAGSVLGTAEYMAPEQADGRPVDLRSDLYSLGTVLYALLCGRPPFMARSLPEVLHMQRFAQPAPIATLATGVPDEFQAIVAQLLEKEPGQRFPNAAVLLRRLESCVGQWASATPAVVLSSDSDSDNAVDVWSETKEEGSGLNSRPAAAEDLSHPQDVGAEAMPAENPPPGRLGATIVTSALKHLPPVPGEPAQSHAANPAGNESPAPSPFVAATVQAGNRFVPVADRDLDAPLSVPQTDRWLISLQTCMLALSLIGLAGVMWYFLQPPTADGLYDAIAARTADMSIASLLHAESEINDFLLRFPRDPRSSQLCEYAREIELYHLERKFEHRAAGLLRDEHFLPVERAYLEAVQQSHTDVEAAIAKLQALVDLYHSRNDTTGPANECVELARRRLDRLREQVAAQAMQYLGTLQDRLDLADALAKKDPASARAMRQAVIELYGSKDWAALAVARAREALAHPHERGAKPPAAGVPKNPPK